MCLAVIKIRIKISLTFDQDNLDSSRLLLWSWQNRYKSLIRDSTVSWFRIRWCKCVRILWNVCFLFTCFSFFLTYYDLWFLSVLLETLGFQAIALISQEDRTRLCTAHYINSLVLMRPYSSLDNTYVLQICLRCRFTFYHESRKTRTNVSLNVNQCMLLLGVMLTTKGNPSSNLFCYRLHSV